MTDRLRRLHTSPTIAGWAQSKYGMPAADHAQRVHAGKGPMGWQRSGHGLAEDANTVLANDAALDASDIEVQVFGNEVVLRGSVRDRLSKRRAEALIDQLPRVEHVENLLVVLHVLR